MKRRDVEKLLRAGTIFPGLFRHLYEKTIPNDHPLYDYDVVIIGAGIGGLSCAAAFAREGFRPLVLEKRDRPGGYVTTLEGPNGFIFDFSLRATIGDESKGATRLVPAFPEITDIECVLPSTFYRTIFPDHDIRVPQKNPDELITILSRHFPEETQGIKALFSHMKDNLTDFEGKTWGQMMGQFIKNSKLKAILSATWYYYGLPPDRMNGYDFALATTTLLSNGGYYAFGGSQEISNALMRFIESHGGVVRLNSEVTEIRILDHQVFEIKTSYGEHFRSRAAVSNISPPQTFQKLRHQNKSITNYLKQLKQLRPSISIFQVFLGLKTDLLTRTDMIDTQIFYENTYNLEDSYRAALSADLEQCGFLLTLYDNLYPNYSPAGKNTISIAVAQGYDHWHQFEDDYFAGHRKAYENENKKMAEVLIQRVEQSLLPGLSEAIEVKAVFTPLTCIELTGSDQGAIFGWEPIPTNQRPSRSTPVKDLYLAGAWTQPGAGIMNVILSGIGCFTDIMKSWFHDAGNENNST